MEGNEIENEKLFQNEQIKTKGCPRGNNFDVMYVYGKLTA